jgi:DNA helicase-2/ATP-dependent DNA helicase PcrA
MWQDRAMRFVADLHVHSKYSRACSRDCDLHHLSWWARRKGVTLVGTGDFTHPAWYEHLRENLVAAEPGLFRLRGEVERDVTRTLPPILASAEVRFMLSVEISTIYKRGERTRKVHHLVYLPDFEAAAEFNRRLGRIGNLGSDGRPILGLDSRDLLEITLECGDGGYLVPAHIWTPWFAVLGSKSGFDAIEDCYADLAGHIFAVETGLSSDPAMNWRVSGLDRYRLVSNSDAHSPPILGREATVFDTALDYFALRGALETGNGLAGTVEFFPEEGKYHVDGHRACGVRLEPAQTAALGGLCPECGKPLTVGVLSRVEELADRPAGVRPASAAEFRNLVPLPEIMSEILGTGSKSKTVLREIDRLTAALGPELAILQDLPVADVEGHAPLLAEALGRMRRGAVIRDAGFDGEYGKIRLFEPGELARLRTPDAPALFAAPPPQNALSSAPRPAAPRRPVPPRCDISPLEPVEGHIVAQPGLAQPGLAQPGLAQPGLAQPGLAQPGLAQPGVAQPGVAQPGVVQPRTARGSGSLLDGLDPEQRAAAEVAGGPLLIIAGPGTGKTRTVTHRIAHLVTAGGVDPRHCLAITFTRRAADELAHRLAALAKDRAPLLTVSTFHALGLRILREQHRLAGLGPDFGIADEAQRLAITTEMAGDQRQARQLLARLSQARRVTWTESANRPTQAREPANTPTRTGEHAGAAPGAGRADRADRAGRADRADRVGAELAEPLQRYLKALRQLDLVDFDDLVALPLELLTADPELAASYRDRFRWITVDEYQDIDEQQYRLLRQLAPPAANLTAIGDPDQAIYRFRGADVGFFLRFQQDYPDAHVARLANNYRSGATIVGSALRVIAPQTLVPGRELRPVGGHADQPIGLHQAATEQAEAAFVATTIERLLGGTSLHALDTGLVDARAGAHHLALSDFAVLYRTDRQAQAVMAALTQAGLPFQKRSHDRLADRPGVAAILRELTASAPASPSPGTAATDSGPVDSGPGDAGPGDAGPGDAGPTDGGPTSVGRTGGGPTVAGRVRAAAKAVLAQLPEGSDAGTDLATEIHVAAELLAPLAARCGTDLARLRNELLLGVEVDTWDPRADLISLLTLHAAKGLEFPAVFIVGCEHGLLPLQWGPTADADPEQLAEERRLLFVGITRAQQHLYLSHAAERTHHGRPLPRARSPFLDELDDASCQQLGQPTPRRRPQAYQPRLL